MRRLTCRIITAFMMFVFLGSCSNEPFIDCGSIILSPVADQDIYEQTHSYVFLSAVVSDMEKLKFHIESGPPFIKLEKRGRGRAELVIDAPKKSKGDYAVRIVVEDGTSKACVDFIIHVYEPKGRLSYCDPTIEAPGDGSVDSPYGSLQRLFDTGFAPKKGDILLLKSGNHGKVVLTGHDFEVWAKANERPSISGLRVNESKNLIVGGLLVSQSLEGLAEKDYLVMVDTLSSYITFRNNKVYSVENSANWTIKDWKNKASRGGVKCKAKYSVIQNNLFQNIFHGIKTEVDSTLISYNHVDRFSGDAIRNTGSYNVFEYNFLTNATVDDYYAKDGNHDDLFQSWTFGDPIIGVELLQNIMISCADPNMALRSKVVQGLVCFDGFEKAWIVEGNLVVTDHPHGISLYGAEDCTIKNNVVLRNPYRFHSFESDPWIMVNDHKDGRKSANNIVRDNVTSALNILSSEVILDGNTIIDSTSTNKLINYEAWDFRTKK